MFEPGFPHRHVFTGEKVAVKVIDKLKLDQATRMQMLQVRFVTSLSVDLLFVALGCRNYKKTVCDILNEDSS